ncbi:heparin lyase I family protein [Dyadobacter bucti]|uniref:heparin lyase I family protein n=1 Tax=Dyadobacter bucti TaxID=2572203 RepID=UPI003F70CC01
MKKLFLLVLLLTCGFETFSQATETNARQKIAVIAGKKVAEIPNYGISNAMKAIADMAAKRVPYLTATELRAGRADTARAVMIIDQASRGTFYYTPGSSATDNGTTTLVTTSGRVYIKDVVSGGSNPDASALTIGQLPDARLSTNVPKKNTANTFTQANTFSAATQFSAPVVSTAPITASALLTYKAPRYADNAAALAGGLKVDDVYKNADSVLTSVHPAIGLPTYLDNVSSGNTRTLYAGTAFEQVWKAQSAGEPWSIAKTSSTAPTTPGFRFEVRPGDVWPTDETNIQNGQQKERSEVYQNGVTLPYDQDIWTIISVKIEPGADIYYGNPRNADYNCFLLQWHQKRLGGGPSWGIDLVGQGELRFTTRGQQNAPDEGLPSLPAQVRGTATVPRGVWFSIVVRARHNKNTGQFQAWVNETEVCNVSNIPLGYNDDAIGYQKFGIYRTAHSTGYKVPLAVQFQNPKVSQTSLLSKVGAADPIVP